MTRMTDTFVTIPLGEMPRLHRAVIMRAARELRSTAADAALMAMRSIRPLTEEHMQQVRSYFADLEPDRVMQFCVRLQFLELPHAAEGFTRELLNTRELTMRHLDEVFFVVRNASDGGAAFEIDRWVLLVHEDSQVRYTRDVRLVLYGAEYVQVTVLMHTPTASEADTALARTLRSLLRAVCHRTNQLLLLNQLHETFVCPSLLIAPQPGDDPSDDPPTPRLFGCSEPPAPASFACAEQAVLQFPLHARLPLDHAVRIVAEEALLPFAVSNRGSVFVYKQKDGSIFYMRLQGEAPNSEGGTTDTRSNDGFVVLRVYGVVRASDETVAQLSTCRLASACACAECAAADVAAQ